MWWQIKKQQGSIKLLCTQQVAPGSTHDTWLLRDSILLGAFSDGDLIRNKAIGDFGQIPMVTVGDSAFPQ